METNYSPRLHVELLMDLYGDNKDAKLKSAHLNHSMCLTSKRNKENCLWWLIKLHTMQTYGSVEVERHTFLTSVLDGDECLASRHDRFTSEKRTLTPTGWEGGCVPQPVWTRGQRQKSCPARKRNSEVQPVA